MTPQQTIINSREELWSKFKSILGESSIDNKNNSMYDLESHIKTTLINLLEAQIKDRGERRKIHKEFECNGAHNGKGCYESWCEDQNCRNAPKEWNLALDQENEKDRELITFISNNT